MFTKKELALINEALMAYGIEEDNLIYKKIDKPVETTNEQALYTEEDIKNFGLFLGSNYKRLKNKQIDDIFQEYKG